MTVTGRELGARLKAARPRRLTQAAVAQALGVSADTIGRWEAGDTEPGASQLARLAELYGVSVARLLEAP